MEQRLLWRQLARVEKKLVKPVIPRPSKRAGNPSHATLEKGIQELEECLRDIGQGRMGPIQRGRGHLIVPLRAADDQTYYLRVTTRKYIVKPRSCTFVNAEGEATDRAWPEYDRSGPFRPPVFICTPPIAEFYDYHDERSYDPKVGTLVNTVCTVFAALNSPDYGGRFDPAADRMADRRRRNLRERQRQRQEREREEPE